MPDTVRFDLLQRARYSQGAGIYRIVPAAVGRPERLGPLRQLLARARDKGWSVTPRGAGSAMDGGNLGEGLLLDLSAFERDRCVIDAVHRIARTSPSVTLADLNQAAGAAGLRLPPDPSSAAWATLGGMVSTNASGARSFRFGSVRRWVTALTLETDDGPLRLERGAQPDQWHPIIQRWNVDVVPRLVLHRGEILERFPRVTKNSTGYALDQLLRSGDLLDVVIGAEGTLGVVSDISWRLDPIPRHRVSVRLLVRTRQDLVPAMAALRRHDPTTMEFLDRSFLKLVDLKLAGDAAEMIPEVGGVLLSDFEGDLLDEVLLRAQGALADVAPWIRHGTVAAEPIEIEQLWQIRHGASPALARLDDGRRSLQVIEDGAVPATQLSHYLDRIDQACEAEGIAVVLFGHAGDGHVHANLLPNVGDTDWQVRVERIFERVTAAVVELGGSPSGEHGTGRLRSGVLERVYGATIMEIFYAVRRAFDPAGRQNPGVLLPDGRGPLAALKVGRDAEALPPGVELYLAQIEQGASWGESRWLER